MNNQALFSLKDKSKKLKCSLLQFLFGALRVKSAKNAGNTKFNKVCRISQNVSSMLYRIVNSKTTG